jgi:hypothetical protein
LHSGVLYHTPDFIPQVMYLPADKPLWWQVTSNFVIAKVYIPWAGPRRWWRYLQREPHLCRQLRKWAINTSHLTPALGFPCLSGKIVCCANCFMYFHASRRCMLEWSCRLLFTVVLYNRVFTLHEKQMSWGQWKFFPILSHACLCHILMLEQSIVLATLKIFLVWLGR